MYILGALLRFKLAPYIFQKQYIRLAEEYTDIPVATKPVQFAELRDIVERLLGSLSS